ncbi:MAG: ABC transporter ATP-binding protein [Dehalococcoidia bacterium]
MSHGEVVVRTSNLRKVYGGTPALRGLDLELRAGEVFGFLGPNGAGKTTTVKLLLGLVRPTAGSVELFGQPLAGNERRLLPRVGAIVEAPAFYPYLSARDNLRVLARLGGVDGRRIHEVIEMVGLGGAERHRFSHYSMGMKQRLGLASVLLRDPQLVILDEPTSGLDPEGQRDVDGLIRRLASEGRTVFLCSHLLGEVEEICDRVAIVRAGEKLFEGTVADLVRGDHQVAVRVPEPPVAVALLRSLAWISAVTVDGDYVVVDAPAERTGDIAAALAGAGIFPTELRPRRRTIEALYHEVMGAVAA